MSIEVKQLSAVCELVKGVTFSRADSSDIYFENSVPIIRAGNIQEELLLESDLVYVPSRMVKKNQFIKEKDILMCTSSGSIRIVGKCAISKINWEGSFGAFNICIRPKELVDPKFIFYYLRSPKFKNWTLLSSGSNIKNIRSSELAQFKIPLPPLLIQQKIAQILDQADALRKKTLQIIDSYDELAQSVFLDMFGDPVTNPKGLKKVALSQIANKITDGTHDTPERLSEGIKFITGKHIRPFNIDYDNSDYVTIDIHNEIFKRCNPEYGDVLYTNIGVNLGTAAINTVEYEFSMKNVALIKPKKSALLGKYLEYYLNSKNVKSKILRIGSIGGAQQFLSLKEIRKLDIYIPNIEKQEKFAIRIDLIEQQKNLAKQSLKQSEHLFNSLLQKAFKGELVNS
jgi:type I restriction enzyme S subunit